jgi:hypothetical protein
MTQVVGFFSKEKMSWDANNLACILIFPPWQRKSLGLLLIAVSYALARRDGLLGGPERPISDLGRRGYTQYWCREVARFLLDLRPDRRRPGTLVALDDVSRATWIAPDDVLAALREFGPLVVPAGQEPDGLERLCIDKAALRQWVQRTGCDLAPVVDPDGFLDA